MTNKSIQIGLVSNNYRSLPVWLLLVIFVVSIAIAVIIVSNAWPTWLDSNEMPIPDAVSSITFYICVLVLLLIAAFWLSVDRKCFLIERPHKRQLLHYSVLAVPLVAFSVLAIYLVYLPLSYFWPAFVADWLLTEQSPVIWPRASVEAVVGSAANVVVLVVLGPYVEEVLFRGFLLNRCLSKWQPSVAIAVTSLCFAIYHIDLLGAFVFSVLLCVIYMKTRSLVGPLIIHIANNAIAVLLDVVFVFYIGSAQATVSEFQAYWWVSVIAAVISIPWLVWYWRNYISRPVVVRTT